MRKRMRRLLLPLSLLYWLGVAVRNWFFDIGILKITKVNVPVISIGNISTGGAGKTPIVEMLIEGLIDSRRLSVVSRGYGRKSSGTMVVNDGFGNVASIEDAGDEPSQLANKFPGLIIVVDEKRVRGAQKAVELGAEIVLLDDGFQHRYLHRDLNLVVMTADEILNDDLLLPAGNRREPMSSLKRADKLMITRCKNNELFDRASGTLKMRFKAGNYSSRKGEDIIGLQTKFKSIKWASTSEKIEPGQLTGKKIIAFSGIGDPNSFESFLIDEGMIVIKHFAFSDHHWFSGKDIELIIKARKTLDADYIITTEKDFMRLRDRHPNFLRTEPVIVAEIQQVLIAGKEKLDASIKHVLVK
jgi:tetraacyldisaccharide 4'-kinase